MKKILSGIAITFFAISISKAQDSTLLGKFSVGILGQYCPIVQQETETYNSNEIGKGGFKLFMKYFRNNRWALTMSFQNTTSYEMRLDKKSKARIRSFMWGLEHHIPIGKIVPYLGLEGGFSFHKYKTHLTSLPQNQLYFIDNFPLVAARPKIGVGYLINPKIRLDAEYSYNWNFSFDKASRNPLFDENGAELYFSRKSHAIGLGISYFFE